MNIITLKKILLVSVLIATVAFNSFAEVILSENFSGGPSSYYTGSHTFSSLNTWDLVQITAEASENTVGGIGGAVRFFASTTASIITPSLNSVGTITFQYRELNAVGGGSFTVSKSVNGAAYTTIGTQSFSGIDYLTYSVVVNDLNNNIKIKISTNSTTYLIVDEMEVTNYVIGPSLNASPSILSGFSYASGSGPSTSKTYNLSATNLSGAPNSILISAPTNYEVSLDDLNFSTSVNVAFTSSTLLATPIYVRLKAGLPVSAYNSELITNVGGGATLINVTCNGSVSAAPYLTLSSSTLAGFTYIEGFGPSVSQSYNISGGALSGAPGNIVVTAPASYEVSIDNLTFSNVVDVTYSSSYLALTPVYVRLKAGLLEATYNSELITNSVSGATTKTVLCNGNVGPAPLPYLTVSSTSLSGFSYIEGYGLSSSQSYELSGGALTGYPGSINVTAPADYEISTDNSVFMNSLNVTYTSSTLSSTPIYVRLKSGLTVNSYNGEIITNSGGGATTVEVTCNGSVSPVPPATLNVSTSTISGFTYVFGTGPSTSQTYNLSGSYLTGFPGDITLNSPTNYEISTNDVTYSNTLNISYTSATLSSTPIYVRLKSGLTVNSYNGEIITNSGGGASQVDVTCNGDVMPVTPPTLVLSSTSLSGFSYIEGLGPSTSQSYNISGTNLTGYPDNIVIASSVNYEISSDNSIFATILNIPYTNSTLTSTPIYVRLKTGLTVNSYNGELITNSGGGASTVEVTCNGNVSPVPPPTLNISTSALSGFTYVVGSGPSLSQTYTLSGSYLTGATGNIVVTAPSNYEVSTDNATFTNSLNIPYTSSTLSSTAVYVRLISGLSVNTYNGEIITNTGGGATQVDVSCNGTVSDVSNACATDLIISEYHEPASGNNKGVEVYNATGGDVDLSNYYIGIIVNGGTDIENSQVLSGILSDKQTVCIYNDQDADPTFRLKGNINITWINATWNGDDAVYLLKGGATKDFIIDAIGNMPPVTDPGTEFLDNGVGTANATLIRKSNVISATTIWSGLEWNDIAPGTYSDWGIHTMTCTTGNLNNENQSNFDISLFPNPANNNITINYNGKLSDVVAVKIINSIGKILQQTDNDFSSILNTSIDIDFCSGLYFVFLETENKTFIKKLIINKK
ncbi:MAG: hypothetical protein A2033_18315 [Bacteroidetes bacterium GWA2_31_9]|nr:MAG: hypothetical protein A2033_18315 [Bacteroidetes bacterium GWA2_31_9]